MGRECTCPSIGKAEWCPAHALWDHLRRRTRELRAQGVDASTAEEAPLFVNSEGGRATRGDLQSWIEEAAADRGERLQGEDGLPRYGTHSLRVAGALVAFAGGASEEVVRSLGRWKTISAMMAYLRGAPLVRAAAASHEMAKVMAEAEKEGSSKGQTHVAPLMKELLERGGSQSAPQEGLRVIQGLSGKVHRPLIASGPPETWITVCGWPWAKAGFAGWFPGKHREEACKRCFPRGI